MRFESHRLALALAAAAAVACHASPVSQSGRAPAPLPELERSDTAQPGTYGYNPNPPEIVPALPPGSVSKPPAGKAAVTLRIEIPDKFQSLQADRTAQYIDWSSTNNVFVRIVGENLTNPVSTTVSVSAGSKTAAATLVLNAGRNQIITAEARTSSNKVLSTVKGVVTTVAGQVATAQAKYGALPLADVFSKLSTDSAPLASAAAISGVIDPILNRQVDGSGNVSYTKHPLFIDSTAIANAFTAAVAGGKAADAVTTQDINSQLGSALPVLAAGNVLVRIVDPNGTPLEFKDYPFPTSQYRSQAYDYDNDGVPDAMYPRGYCNGYRCGSIIGYLTLMDPITSDNNGIGYSGTTTAYRFTSVPPGNWVLSNGFGFNEYSNKGLSKYPWLVSNGGSYNLTVLPGSTATADIKLVDVSQSTSIGESGGSFTSPRRYEWYRFPTSANIVYTLAYSGTSCSSYGGYYVFVVDASGTTVHNSLNTNGTYDFASPATNSLYVWSDCSSLTVNVSTTRLGEREAVVKPTVSYNE